MQGGKLRRSLPIIALSLMLVSPSGAAFGQSVEDFYKKNNTVTILTGFGPGTGYDNWARVVAQYMAKYMAGRPTFLVKAMPGAGSLLMANHLYNQAPKDGTVIGVFSRQLPFQAMLGVVENARFDPRAFAYIGSPEKSPTVVCAAMVASGVTSVEDLQRRELLVGGTGPATGPSFLPVIVNQVAGTKFKVIEGYPGTSDVYLAMERGEVGGVCQGLEPLVAGMQERMKRGELRVLFNFEEKRVASLPGVPSIFEYLKDQESRQIMAFVNSSPQIGRPFAAPPGVPSDRLAALRSAFEKALADPGFAADAAKMQLEAGLVTGPEIERIVNDSYALPKSVMEKAAAMMPKGG
jgi:tripartite-type tricarboxylate transporter receptor subunit TctC